MNPNPTHSLATHHSPLAPGLAALFYSGRSLIELAIAFDLAAALLKLNGAIQATWLQVALSGMAFILWCALVCIIIALLDGPIGRLLILPATLIRALKRDW